MPGPAPPRPDRIVGVNPAERAATAPSPPPKPAPIRRLGAFSRQRPKPPSPGRPRIAARLERTTRVRAGAIGGLARELRPLVEAGADFLAVIGAIWSHPKGPRRGARIQRVFARYGRALSLIPVSLCISRRGCRSGAVSGASPWFAASSAIACPCGQRGAPASLDQGSRPVEARARGEGCGP